MWIVTNPPSGSAALATVTVDPFVVWLWNVTVASDDTESTVTVANCPSSRVNTPISYSPGARSPSTAVNSTVSVESPPIVTFCCSTRSPSSHTSTGCSSLAVFGFDTLAVTLMPSPTTAVSCVSMLSTSKELAAEIVIGAERLVSRA